MFLDVVVMKLKALSIVEIYYNCVGGYLTPREEFSGITGGTKPTAPPILFTRFPMEHKGSLSKLLFEIGIKDNALRLAPKDVTL